MIRKTLTSIGNSMGVVIDRPILDLLGISKNTVLSLELRDDALVIYPERARGASSADELFEWARSLLVRLESASDDPSPALDDELVRFDVVRRVFHPNPRSHPPLADVPAARVWMRRVVEQHLRSQPPPEPPIITRTIAREVLEELAEARGAYREITAGRPYAGAAPDLVANVLWFLIARAHVELHPESRVLRPIVERLRMQQALSDHVPESVMSPLSEGVTLMRLTAAGGEYLHQLRRGLG